MMLRRHGFTLIELLVVIAIIGILAAMLFPVFARARESARKIQCLSNIKNIALSLQMYLTDYDRLPPSSHSDQAALDFFDSRPGGRTGNYNGSWNGHCGLIAYANPYVAWPVVLEEYIKNRDVWRCPSARMMSGARFIYGTPNWLQELKDTIGQWGENSDWEGGPCQDSYPMGWGGTITDSIVQQTYATDRSGGTGNGAFIQSIATNATYMADVSTAQINDAARTIGVADSGPFGFAIAIGVTAFPDICVMECGNCAGWVDWQNCPWSQDCGSPKDGYLLTNTSARKHWARHMGGVNLGFLDGHAKWMNSDALVAAFTDSVNGNTNAAVDANWIGWWGPPAWCGGSSQEWAASSGNQPELVHSNW